MVNTFCAYLFETWFITTRYVQPFIRCTSAWFTTWSLRWQPDCDYDWEKGGGYNWDFRRGWAWFVDDFGRLSYNIPKCEAI